MVETMAPRERLVTRVAVILGALVVLAFDVWFGLAIQTVDHSDIGFRAGFVGVCIYSALAFAFVWPR